MSRSEGINRQSPEAVASHNIISLIRNSDTDHLLTRYKKGQLPDLAADLATVSEPESEEERILHAFGAAPKLRHSLERGVLNLAKSSSTRNLDLQVAAVALDQETGIATGFSTTEDLRLLLKSMIGAVAMSDILNETYPDSLTRGWRKFIRTNQNWVYGNVSWLSKTGQSNAEALIIASEINFNHDHYDSGIAKFIAHEHPSFQNRTTFIRKPRSRSLSSHIIQYKL